MNATNTQMNRLTDHIGGWTDGLEQDRRSRPLFFERLAAMVSVPADRDALGDVERALIGVAVVGNVANTNWTRLDAHVRRALRAGATPDQVRDVLQMVSIMSIHAMTSGLPALMKVLRERGLAPTADLDAHRQRLKDEFERRRGYWHDSWNDVLTLAPEMFEAYTAFSAAATDEGALDEKLRELIYIAIDCIPTHMYAPGVEIHARRALDAGATPEQIVTAIEIAALVGADPYIQAAQSSSLFEGQSV
ncbi:carboxymuconolactone decarboxylase family protein [Mycolicibacterium goodii]|uniref:Carboxymuconolactone decarboxylase n=1 Tax=Mycolicibacterium goodii TaxID=134601 RepID=A0A0K0X3P0_MYCGD|nr:carboxymuconolactone decarboxylase [Mycolicibacterium goodii]